MTRLVCIQMSSVLQVTARDHGFVDKASRLLLTDALIMCTQINYTVQACTSSNMHALEAHLLHGAVIL